MDEPIIFDSTMEQKLLSAHQDWLASRQVQMLQWNQAQDMVMTCLGLLIAVMGAYIITLDYRIDKLERRVHVDH